MSAFNFSGMPLPVVHSTEKTRTQRPVSTAILGIDSEDRYTSYAYPRTASTLDLTTPYEFTITKSNSILNGTFTRIAVSEVLLNWALPNINETNNVIIVKAQTLGPTPVPVPPPGPAPLPVPGPLLQDIIVVPKGFYTPSQLATQLQTQIRASAILNLPLFTLTYGIATVSGVNTNRCVFQYSPTGANPNPNNVAVAFEPIPASGSFPATTKQLFDLLGFCGNNSVIEFDITFPWQPIPIGVGNNYGSCSFAQYTKYVDIVCSQLTTNQVLRDSSTLPAPRDLLARVYLCDNVNSQNVMPSASSFAPPGTTPFTIHRNFSVPKQIQWRFDSPIPGSLTFELYDDSGNNLRDTAGLGDVDYLDWCLTLLVSEN